MQLPSMPTNRDGLEEAEYEVLPPLNPLQTNHKHLYSSKTAKPSRFSFIEGDAGEKAKRRASRQMKPTTEPVRSDSVTMKRRTSRLGMFGLFTRTKNPDFQNAETSMDTPMEEEEPQEKEDQTVALDPGVVASVTAPPPIKDDSDSDPQVTSLRRRASKRALKTKESFIKPKPKSWEPPPLFQAYPQSIKHATLSTPTIPAESLIRLNHEKQQKAVDQSRSNDQTEMTKKQKEKKLRKSQALELVNTRDWAPKVFALVTEGYLLQYAGQGSHDRLPEKILPLCKQSAAFATDVIRGKPFVLQISQTSGEDGMVDTDISRELLKRANLKSEIKRTASAFLLVLGSPEELNEWLVAVRKEIEQHGGKEYRPDVFGTDGMNKQQMSVQRKTAQGLQRVPSQRYLVKRDPFQFSPKLPASPCLPPSEEKVLEQTKPQASRGLGISSANRYSFATSESTYSRYQSDTTASIDQAQLDRLRETPRQSYMSADAKTASTSRCSSMERSPTLGRHDTAHEKEQIEQRRQSHAIRKAESKTEVPQIKAPDRSASSPQAVSGVSTSTAVASPPPTPNFSVPTFSKRFSMTPSARSTSQTSQAIPSNVAQSARKVSIENRPGSNSSTSNASHKQDSRPSSQRPWSAESNNRPQSAGSDARWSRRNSSLNYSRGISPIHHPHHSPSPHPPPTIALPPLPVGIVRPSTAAVPAPTVAPPPPPVPAPTAAVQEDPVNAPHLQTPLEKDVALAKPEPPKIVHPPSAAPTPQTEKPRKLRRPSSMQVRHRPPTPPNSHHAVAGKTGPNRTTSRFRPKNPLVSSSEPKKAAAPLPSAPPPSPKLASKRFADAGLGISASQLPHVPPAETSEPHAYIPPISVSNRRSGLSLDGPWNNASFTIS